MKLRNKSLIGLLILSTLFFGMIPAQAALVVPLQDHVSLGTYVYTAVDSSVTKTDYMLVDHYFYTTMGESVWASDGETAAGTGTSYIKLEDSCIIGDYASYPYAWADFSYLKASYSSTVTKVGGDSAWVVGTNCTAPSLSAGATTSYISLQMAGDASAGGGTAEEISFTSDCWFDIDSDGVDDSATVPEEDYIPFASTTYLYGVAKVDASDVDKDAHGYIKLGFYVDSSTTYDMSIYFQGGEIAADSAFACSWTYTGATSTKLDFFEVENDAVAFLIDIADEISDDTDSSPVIAGLDWIKLGIYAEDAYGDGSSDTIDFYVYNLALFDEIPAITDNDASTTWDINQGANIAIYGEDQYYLSHDSLQPIITAATDNAPTTYVYLDKDLKSGTYLHNKWRHIEFDGTARLNPSSGVISTERGDPPNLRSCDYVFTMNQLRISDGDNIISTYAPSYSSQLFKIKTDDDDFYSPEKEYDEDILSASISGVDETDTFKSALANQNDNTWVTFYTWGTVVTTGTIQVSYSYNTQESGKPAEAGLPGFGLPAISGTSAAIVAIIAIVALVILRARKKGR